MKSVSCFPDCPVCGRSIPKILRYEDDAVTCAKRTCPKCDRRFLFKIIWHDDRPNEVHSERITDYQKPKKKPERPGKYVLVKYVGNQVLAAPERSRIVRHLVFDRPSTEKPKLNKVILKFDLASEAGKYAEQYYCPRFLKSADAKQAACWTKAELVEHFGPDVEKRAR